MSDDLVSVILPVRNGGHWLQQAVDSILRQSHRQLELLLIDDHSDDGAVRALDRSDARLRILDNPGAGLVDALNHGFAAARGNWLARMDADDVALPERLATQLGHLRRHPQLAICATRVQIIGTAVQAGSRRYERWLNALLTPEAIAAELFVESPLPHPSVMLRRSAWQQLGGYVDGPEPEDYALWLTAARRGMQFGKPPEVLLHWREHPARMTRNDPRYGAERFRALKVRHLLDWRCQGRPLWIWGAGRSGVALHDALRHAGAAPLAFVDVHPRRIGGRKRGLPVHALEAVSTRPADVLVLVAVGSVGAREDIRAWCSAHGQVEGEDYLFTA